MTSSMVKRTVTASAAVAMVLGMAACGNKTAASSDGEVKDLKIWDGYTQYDENSPLGKMYSKCADQVGVKLDRTTDSKQTDTLLQNAATGNLPDMTILEYSYVPQFAKSGLLADNDTTGLDASGQLKNVLASGEYEGKTYGASIGFNSLALYYDPDKLAAAGIDKAPTNWDELREDAKKLTNGDQKGFGFSAFANEDGVHQFLPFFWGAGADLTKVDSKQGVEALTYMTDLIKDGSVSSDVVNWNQQDVRDQYTSGHIAMMLNGTWQLNDLDKAGAKYKVAPFPGKDGAAPVPLGGEFIEAIKTGNAARMKKAGEFIQCVISPDGMKDWAKGQTYIIPTQSGMEDQAKSDPRLESWVESAKNAKSKVAELGADYPNASLALQTAVQSALSGKSSPADALTQAQKDIDSKK